MTVRHWNEQDYYRASRQARAAWQQTNSQLALDVDGLDETETAPLRLVEPACPPRSTPLGGLTPGARSTPRAASGADRKQPRRGEHRLSTGALGRPHHTDGPCRISPEEQRGKGQKGQ